MPRLLPPVLVLSTLILALLAPTAASGATYTQHVCKLPDGTPTIADGFAGYTLGTSSTWGDGCLAGNPLFASVPGTSSGTTKAGLKFFAPSGTSVVGVRVTRDTAGIGLPG